MIARSRHYVVRGVVRGLRVVNYNYTQDRNVGKCTLATGTFSTRVSDC